MTSTPSSAAGIQDAARHLAEGRPAEAATVLERLVADFPVYVTAHVLLAKAYEANGRDLEALEAWHHAYFLMPSSPLIVRERTRLLRVAPVSPAEPGEQAAAPVAADKAEGDAQAGAAHEESISDVPAAEPEAEPEAPAEDEREAEVPAESAGVAPEVAEEPDDAVPEAEPDIEPDIELAPGPEDGPLGEVDDLDTLIHQLETAPRIRPDPDFRDEGLDEEDEEEGLVSETLARIYATQKQYAAAARAYEQLAELHPDRAAEFEAKASEMYDRAASSGS